MVKKQSVLPIGKKRKGRLRFPQWPVATTRFPAAYNRPQQFSAGAAGLPPDTDTMHQSTTTAPAASRQSALHRQFSQFSQPRASLPC
ncbi:MAG: hypothetical protein V4462_14980 [Pseudomonadota bacterium]